MGRNAKEEILKTGGVVLAEETARGQTAECTESRTSPLSVHRDEISPDTSTVSGIGAGVAVTIYRSTKDVFLQSRHPSTEEQARDLLL